MTFEQGKPTTDKSRVAPILGLDVLGQHRIVAEQRLLVGRHMSRPGLDRMRAVERHGLGCAVAWDACTTVLPGGAAPFEHSMG